MSGESRECRRVGRRKSNETEDAIITVNQIKIYVENSAEHGIFSTISFLNVIVNLSTINSGCQPGAVNIAPFRNKICNTTRIPTFRAVFLCVKSTQNVYIWINIVS